MVAGFAVGVYRRPGRNVYRAWLLDCHSLYERNVRGVVSSRYDVAARRQPDGFLVAIHATTHPWSEEDSRCATSQRDFTREGGPRGLFRGEAVSRIAPV